jgi:hypothetical protein
MRVMPGAIRDNRFNFTLKILLYYIRKIPFIKTVESFPAP